MTSITLSQHKDNLSTVYDNIAREFTNSRHYSWTWVTSFFSEYVYSADKDTKEKLVLDIGCGGGRNIKTYQNDNVKIIGLDNSKEFIKICLEQNLNVVFSDMTKLPFTDNHFDNLISIASFHHLTNNEDRIKAIQEMSRVLKPNGTVIMSIWSKNQPQKTKRTFDTWGDTLVPWKNLEGTIFQRYYYIFKIDEIKSLILNNGFSIVSHSWECGNEVFILENLKFKI